MIDAQLIQDVFRRESRSILQYAGDAFPWASAGEEPMLDQLQTLIQEERDELAHLARFLQRHHVSALPSGSYPVNFTTLNFVSLDHILHLLLRYEEQSLLDLQTAVAEAGDPESRRHLALLLEVKRRHLQTLREMNATARQPAVTG